MKVVPLTYCGYQEGFGRIPGVHLYNLVSEIPGHPRGSTVSEMTLIAGGYEIPENLPKTKNQQTQSEGGILR